MPYAFHGVNGSFLFVEKDEIRKSLLVDRPVPMMVGLDAEKVNLYKVDRNAGLPLQANQLNPPETKSHYVTITDLVVDKIDGKTKLVISSWGSEYVIDYYEYIDKADLLSGILPIIKTK